MRSHMNSRLTGAGLLLVTSALASAACSSSTDDGYATIPQDSSNGSGGDTGSASATDATPSTATANAANVSSASSTGTTTGGLINFGDQPQVEEMACATSDTPTKLQQVVLAFVFDVSASMGNGMFPYFSRTLKWDPVVAATKSFFEDPNSKGLSATLTFFPNELAPIASGMTAGGNGAECMAADYATPDVALTALPSTTFSAAIDAVTPPDDTTWRLGTPTLPAYEGTVQAIQAMQAADPSSKYTIVVVTDGMPALCPGIQDDIGPVAQAAAAVADTISTYVIGVENPVTDEDPNPPDTVSALNELAQAGGTDMAYLINTDDPAQTTAQLKQIIETIREFTFSCSLPIPEPTNGEDFDQNKVNVGYSSPSLGEIPFDYDPTCTAPNSWRYDDELNPTTIQVCDQVCEAIRVQQDEGSLNIQLGCQTRIK